MKIRTLAHLFLALGVICSINADDACVKSNHSDLWTNGLSDAWPNPCDSFDELRAHNHSVNGDNLDWKAHHHDVPGHKKSGCRVCNESQSTRELIAYGYAYEKYQKDQQNRTE